MRIRNGFLVSALLLGALTNGAASTCTTTIDSVLCEELQARNENDWVYCGVFLSAPGWVGRTPCNKEDSTCLNQPPDTSRFTLPDSALKATRLLFETYDIRWPDDLQTRASVPTEGGRRDSVSYQYHRPAFAYLVYATKGTILSLGAESYIEKLKLWPPIPLSLSPSKFILPVRANAPIFNLNGQRIRKTDASSFWVPGFSGNR